MANELALSKHNAVASLATFLGTEAPRALDLIRNQCFRGKDAPSDDQVLAFAIVANEMKVNPLLPGMLYAYPIQGGGIQVMIGPDGIYKKLAEHPEVVVWECISYPEDVTKPPTHATAKIWRTGRDKPFVHTCLLSEWKIASNPNWNSRPRHMLEIRTIKQCARQIVHGIPFDEDERRIADMMNVTGTGQEPTPPPPDRPPADALKKRKTGIAGSGEEAQPAAGSPGGAPLDVGGTQAQTPPADTPAAAGDAPKPSLIEKGQKLTVRGVRVVKADYENFAPEGKDPVHGAKIITEGGWTGILFDLSGGRLVQGKGEILPVWQSNKPLVVELWGRKSGSLGVIATVEAVRLDDPAEADLP